MLVTESIIQKENETKKCDEKLEVYSRVCGFFRPVLQWNVGKQDEFRSRKEFVIKKNV